MPGHLELLDGQSWEAFVRSPVAVLMIGKSDCAACNAWTTELETFLASDTAHAQVRFGKVLLDRPGLATFKRANPWIAELDDLPCNVLFVNGEKRKQWLGGGVARMTGRIDALE